jgi:hypothetical protein
VIVLAGKQGLRFELGDVVLGSGELAVEILQQIVALIGVGLFAGKGDVRVDVAGGGGKLGVSGDVGFRALAIAKNTLGGFLVAPKIGCGGALFECFQALAVLRGVKENSVPAPCAV